MKLFQYAILWHQKLSATQEKDGVKAGHRVVVEPKWVLAKDLAEVQIRAAREIPEDLTKDLEEVEIAVRPF